MTTGKTNTHSGFYLCSSVFIRGNSRLFRGLSALSVVMLLISGCVKPEPRITQTELTTRLMTDRVMTVRGVIAPEEMEVTLPHEHVLVDFIGADQASPSRYDVEEAFRTALPHLIQLRELGCGTIAECTPAYLGRDVKLLRRLSEASGLNIITNTGYYGASDGKFLPEHARKETARQLADRWTTEWRRGIDGTDIRPGFIKIGVNAAPVNELDRKLIEAAGMAHLKTGLTIAAHCPDPTAALDVIAILQRNGVSPQALIWVHADSQGALEAYELAARSGAWVEFDGVSDTSIDKHIGLLLFMKQKGLLHRTLISHDAGWYHVGEPNGGEFRPYTTIAKKLIPALSERGFTTVEIRRLVEFNPHEAFTIRVRGDVEHPTPR
jgi:phosphotriesterase-related protein